jgi:hypothetical protein
MNQPQITTGAPLKSGALTQKRFLEDFQPVTERKKKTR